MARDRRAVSLPQPSHTPRFVAVPLFAHFIAKPPQKNAAAATLLHARCAADLLSNGAKSVETGVKIAFANDNCLPEAWWGSSS
jgi:hypothetical protein